MAKASALHPQQKKKPSADIAVSFIALSPSLAFSVLLSLMAAAPGSIPWVEKYISLLFRTSPSHLIVRRYRPHCLADIVGNDESVERLRVIAEDGNMPHLILTGPPGTGKTSSINALAAEVPACIV